jgi:hypothetical protein
MIVVAEDEAQVRELIKKDIYATSGMWDVERVEIIQVCSSLLYFNLSLDPLLFSSLEARLG